MIKLAEFQLNAIGRLIESMEDNKNEMILKSPTGSGKTIILTHFMEEYGEGHFNNVFIWLTPGKGELEEQSKEKMDRYIHNSQTKLLKDVMLDGFKENDACFINWEKLIKQDNNALKDREKINLKEHIENAYNEGLNFIIIVDEAHQNNTVKAHDIINLFQPKKIIRTSATPQNNKKATIIEVPEADVIAEGLIKKMLVINENFNRDIEIENQMSYLVDKSLDKQYELKKSFNDKGSLVNPLIIIQLPNKSKILQDEVERYLRSKDITYENGLLAVWLSEKKQNLEEIEEIDAKPIVIIMKQAVASGWDCPRSQILVKLRDNTSETFEIQTIGRIRRMPEVTHYGNDLLDSCYLYTMDEKFTEGVKTYMGKSALDAQKIFLKKQYRDVTLVSEQKTDVSVTVDSSQVFKTMVAFYKNKYNTTSETKKNQTRLNINGYVFSEEIIEHAPTGIVHQLKEEEFKNLDQVRITVPLNTHKHGREYHNRVGNLGVNIGLPYERINAIIRRLFDKNVNYKYKILRLETREVYAFVINNFDKLKEDFLEAMSTTSIQQGAHNYEGITETEFNIPKEFLFTFDGENRVQREYESNVYSGYLSSAEIRSDSEKTFEKYCNCSANITWFYKNGDKGNEYFSIVYKDNFGKQKSFYPDYILSYKGEIWIIETKGGFSRTGASEDIDNFSPKKFDVLKRYLNKHNLKGGFVRKDKSNNELFICKDEYTDDVTSDAWQLLDDVFA